MRPVFQTKFKPPDGNCMQACIASVLELDLDDVPNFVDAQSGWWEQLTEWLGKRGLTPWHFSWGPDWRPEPGMWHLIDGPSPRGEYLHVVVGRGGDVVHDPYPGWTGPTFAGAPRGFYVFVARDPAVAIR